MLSIPGLSVSGYVSSRSSGYLSARNSLSPTQYVERLDVRYGEDAFDMPADAIREIHDLSGEVTYQDSGK